MPKTQNLTSNYMAKILIIEDEEFLMKNLQLALAEDFEVIGSANGREGLNKAKQENPDLILLDIVLPDLDGIEVLKVLKADNQTDDIPVIVLTNLSDQATISKILDVGGTEYLVKSDWTIDEVVTKVKQVLKLE